MEENMVMSRGNCSATLSTLVVAAALGIPALVQPAVADVIKSISVGPDQTLIYPSALTTLPDEHTTFFPLSVANSTYLVFAASNIGGGLSGTVALETLDLKTFTYASGYPNPVMVPPVHFTACNPTYDTEFDENYAAPGSVLQDPTRPAGHFIMIYEAENHCPGGANQGNFYAIVGLVRSPDYGKTWPAPVNSEFGNIFRRPVLKIKTPEPTTAPPPGTSYPARGDAIPSAFIDTTPQGEHYIYASYLFFGATADGYLRMARAKLGERRLDFEKWYKGSFSRPGIAGLDSGVTPTHGCAGTTAQYQHGGSISYLTTTQHGSARSSRRRTDPSRKAPSGHR
jgi:hypothetical protein